MPSRRALLCVLATAFVASAAAQAQDKPPLRILVGFPPGGSADVIARLVGDAVRDDFSTVVVENRPGAGGRIALAAVKNAKPDGQTVIILPSGPMVLFPHVYKKLEYDPVKDFTPVSLIAHFQFNFGFGAGTTANALEASPTAAPEPGQMLPVGIALLGVWRVAVMRRRRTV